MLRAIKAQMSLDITVQQCAAGDHLRVHHGVARELTEEVTAMPIRPIHHRRRAQPVGRQLELHEDQLCLRFIAGPSTTTLSPDHYMLARVVEVDDDLPCAR